jgi:hypothetical protein
VVDLVSRAGGSHVCGLVSLSHAGISRTGLFLQSESVVVCFYSLSQWWSVFTV